MATGPTITMPSAGVLGLPTGVKSEGQRVDFKPTKFDLAIETKGYLLAWTRACVCPCVPVSDQTEHPDPNCTLCKGSGWFHFGTNTSPDWDVIGDLDVIQRKIINDNNAMVIRGIITGIQNEYRPWDQLGNWQAGTMQLTVRHENKLGYYDKIVALDSEIVYSEIQIADGTSLLTTRYMVTGVNFIRSPTQEYTPDADYRINASGQIEWIANTPASGTRLGIHYLCHPTWLVIEHPHIIRTTPIKFKTATPTTPQGDPRALPIQAVMRYDFLPAPS